MSFALSNINKKVIFVLFILIVCAIAFLTGTFPLTKLTPNFHRMGMFDWPIFVDAALNFIKTKTLYSPDISLYGPNAEIYKFPPLFASILIQLLQSGLSEASLRYWMGVAHLVAYFGTIIICLKLAESGNKFFLYATTFVFVATFEPFVDNFIGLQLEVFILFLLCVAMYLLTKNTYIAAGVMIGIAASLKLYPLFFCLYFLLQKQWRGLIGVALGILLTMLFSVAVVGYEQHLLYYTKIAPLFLFEPIYTSHQNVSINNLFYHLVDYSGLSSWYSNLPGYFVFLTGIFVLFFFGTKHQSNIIQRERVLVAFSLLVSTFVLASKNSWGNYQLLLVLPVLTILGFSCGKKYVDRFSIIAVFMACALVFFSLPHRFIFVSHYFFAGYPFSENVFIYMRALASLVIFLLCLKLYHRVVYD